MPRITVNVDEETEEWVEKEADRLNWSKSDAGGWCIELLRSSSLHIDPKHTDVQYTDAGEVVDGGAQSLHERLKEIEARLDALEDETAHDASSGARSGREYDAADSPASTTNCNPTADGERAENELRDVVEPAYRDMQDPDARVEIGLAAINWLQNRNMPASGGDFQEALYPETQRTDESADTWWRKNARPALQAAADAGFVNYRPGHHDYQWSGE